MSNQDPKRTITKKEIFDLKMLFEKYIDKQAFHNYVMLDEINENNFTIFRFHLFCRHICDMFSEYYDYEGIPLSIAIIEFCDRFKEKIIWTNIIKNMEDYNFDTEEIIDVIERYFEYFNDSEIKEILEHFR